MAEPISPVFMENIDNQIILGPGDTGSMPLPAYPWKNEFCSFVVSRWKLNPEELAEVSNTGCVYVVVLGESHPALQVQGKMELFNGEPMATYATDPLEDLAGK